MRTVCLCLPLFLFACDASEPSRAETAAAAVENAAAPPTADDSLSCTVDGITFSVVFGEPSGPVFEVRGADQREPNKSHRLTPSRGFSYSKRAATSGTDNTHAVAFGADDESWVVMNTNVNGDEDSGQLSASLPNGTVVTRTMNGGEFFCTLGRGTSERTPVTRRDARARR